MMLTHKQVTRVLKRLGATGVNIRPAFREWNVMAIFFIAPDNNPRCWLARKLASVETFEVEALEEFASMHRPGEVVRG